MTRSTPWMELSRSPPLEEDAVHVWSFPLRAEPPRLREFESILDASERERAHRFHFERDRRRFIVAHGVLREILADYLHRPPAQIEILAAERGKPYLPPEASSTEVRFNLAHSGDAGLLAVTRCRELGVDLEEIRDDLEHRQLAERFFSPSERQTLSRLPEDRQLRQFFACWTRKEAYLKAIGTGLGIPLDQFSVQIDRDELIELLATEHDPAQKARWSLRHLEPGPGWIGALAVEGTDWRLRCLRRSAWE